MEYIILSFKDTRTIVPKKKKFTRTISKLMVNIDKDSRKKDVKMIPNENHKYYHSEIILHPLNITLSSMESLLLISLHVIKDFEGVM